MNDINKLKEFFLSRRAATTAYESTNEQSEDAIDTITMDVPLFIRMLEYAREDASQDVDLHDVTEKIIALNKEVNVLQMEDYDEIIGAAEDSSQEEINEELCPAGKAYVERRKKPKSKGGGGEKHSAYLMGRASKVCKGKISGKKKKK
jgi:hypothetical protein